MRTAALERTLEGHTNGVNSLALDPRGVGLRGERVMSASSDKTIKIWLLLTGECQSTLVGHNGSVYSLCATADGKSLVSASADSTLKVWNIKTGKCMRTLEGHDETVKSVDVSPDGRRIVSGSYDNTVKIWTLKTGRCERT